MKNKLISKALPALLTLMSAFVVCSCDDKDKTDRILGTRFTMLWVYVEDADGNDLVAEWKEKNNDEKVTNVHCNIITDNSFKGSHDEYLLSLTDKDLDRDFFSLESEILSVMDIGESISWSFKMYESDKEYIEFDGTCVYHPIQGDKTSRHATNILWNFKGTDLPVENPTMVTLIRTEDGTYSLKPSAQL